MSPTACGSDTRDVAGPSGGGQGGAADAGSGAADAALPGNDGGLPAAYPAPAADGCITSVAPGHQSLDCEGLEFELWVPDSCLTAACGLIFDVHGFAMTGTLMGNHSKMPELGNAQGYIVVNPSAPTNGGNLFAAAWSSANDDAVFALMNHVIDVWHVDEKRIHFDGYSMGGWMTWRFICKHADIIASAAPLAGGAQPNGQSCAFTETEMPARELPIFYTHGRNDGLVPFSTAITERDAVIAAWQMTESEVVASGPDYDWTRYKNANGTVFEFAQHDWETTFTIPVKLKGHCFPGSTEFLGCGTNSKFNWGEAVLAFFMAHPMP